MLAARVEPKNCLKELPRHSEGRIFADQAELPRAVAVTVGCDGLVVTANLCEVGCLETQGELHQRVCNVSGGFIGDGIFRQFG